MSTDLSSLNRQQYNAVMESIGHNVVLLAGAGSGKTSTLVKRTQYLIETMDVKPENIMLITFTNKAAAEIRDRVMAVSQDGHKMWIGTFHRICTRLLRMFGHKMHIDNFTIMDSREAKAIISSILNSRGAENSRYLVNDIIAKISSYKNNLVRPSKVLADGKETRLFADVYQEYQNICWKRKSFDFDDLIIYTIMLLSSYKDVSGWVHKNIKYVTLDEAQDTCSSQFTLVKLIAGDNNIMLCGDVNQSIYAFRDAKPEYLDRFAVTHPGTVKMKLEQNYRSTRNIINAANKVVSMNDFGTKLTMFCDNEDGDLIQTYTAKDAYAEARWVASEILSSGKDLSDFAVIYRANSQSRIIEEIFTKAGIGYTVFGSQSFYSRKEVKDLVSWCKSVINSRDEHAFMRALGTMKGIGKVTISSIIKLARTSFSNNLHEALNAYVSSGQAKPAQYRALSNANTIFRNKYNYCSEIVNDVIFYTGYRQDIKNVQSEETEEKLAIIDEFIDMLCVMEENSHGELMEEIIDQVSLLSDAKGAEKQSLNAVKLMTAHASKGLEFNTVFIIGAEEGTFPHANALDSPLPSAIEEERRLFYVAMTRAKKTLYITHASQKTSKDSSTSVLRPSRFIKEIPGKLREEAF